MTKKTEAATESASNTFIKYTEFPGIVAERRITQKNLADLGIEHDGDVVFNKANNYVVDAGDFSDEVVSFFKGEPGFSVSGSDKAPRLAGDVPTGGLPSGTQTSGTGGTVTPGGSTASSPSTAR